MARFLYARFKSFSVNAGGWPRSSLVLADAVDFPGGVARDLLFLRAYFCAVKQASALVCGNGYAASFHGVAVVEHLAFYCAR